MDIEALLVPWLAATLNVRAVTELPADLADVLPVVRSLRIGGPDLDDYALLDLPTVTIDCYDAGWSAASTLAGRVHAAIRSTLPGTVHDGGVVTRTRTISGPSWRPYDDTNLRRFGATYQIIVHPS